VLGENGVASNTNIWPTTAFELATDESVGAATRTGRTHSRARTSVKSDTDCYIWGWAD